MCINFTEGQHWLNFGFSILYIVNSIFAFRIQRVPHRLCYGLLLLHLLASVLGVLPIWLWARIVVGVMFLFIVVVDLRV